MRTTLKVTLASTGLAFAATVAVFPWLPERFPTHFDVAGNPNNFAPRAVGAFLLPAFMVVLIAIDLVRRGANAAIGATTSIVSVFFLFLQVLMLRAALSGGGLGNAVWLVMGVAFFALGLIMPRVRRNRWVGLRTRWSMSSPEAWARSQRAGGFAMIVAGSLLALSSTWDGASAHALRLLAIFGAAFVSIAYSYVAARTSS
jgi:uncharacterized membrane protein